MGNTTESDRPYDNSSSDSDSKSRPMISHRSRPGIGNGQHSHKASSFNKKFVSTSRHQKKSAATSNHGRISSIEQVTGAENVH